MTSPEPDAGAAAGEERSGAEVGRRRRGLVRRMYDWVLSFADRPSGERALFAFAFAESSFFPIPPDPLLIALALGAPRRALRFALVCSIASVLGGLAGYGIGWGLWHAVGHLFYAYVPGVSPAAFASVQTLYNRYDFWAIFAAGFTPIPFKVFTLSAGVFRISLPIFLFASAVSRSARFFLIAGLIYMKGPSIQGFIDRHFDRLAWIFLVLLIGGFLVVKLALR